MAERKIRGDALLDAAFELETLHALVARTVIDGIPIALGDETFSFVELKILHRLFAAGSLSYGDLGRAASVTDLLLAEVIWSLSEGGYICDEGGMLSLDGKGIRALRDLQAATTNGYRDALQRVPLHLLEDLAKVLSCILPYMPEHPLTKE